jgi:general secretion pathway protein N
MAAAPGLQRHQRRASAPDCCTTAPLQLRAALGFGSARITVSDGVSMWPAAVLAGLGTPWNTLQLDGELGLSTQGLSVEWSAGRLALGGRAEMAAARISSRLSTLRPMGSYRITLTGGATSTLELATLEGSLQLSGNGRWVGSRCALRAWQALRPSARRRFPTC